jgi:Gly-Xaa carboxypeptidase
MGCTPLTELALENLIAAEFQPTRSIVLAFGFDEESSGARGAGELSGFLLQKHGQNSFSAILDEGAGYYAKWGKTFALPGVAEKGYIDINIVVRMPGGHSSIPPDHNGIGVMSQLVTLIEANLYEPKLVDDNPYLGMLKCGAAHGSKFPSKLKKLLSRRSSKSICSKKTDRLAIEASKDGLDIKYLMTTSVAVDIIRGGVKNNALPERTQVTVNHRINVGETTAVVKDKITHLAKHVAAKYNLTVHAFSDEEESPSSITISSGHELEPSPITPTVIDSFTPYSVLSGTIRALFGEEIVISPGIMTGMSSVNSRSFMSILN